MALTGCLCSPSISIVGVVGRAVGWQRAWWRRQLYYSDIEKDQVGEDSEVRRQGGLDRRLL